MSQETRDTHSRETPGAWSWGLVALTWTLVSIPLLWGIWKTLEKAVQFFR